MGLEIFRLINEGEDFLLNKKGMIINLQPKHCPYRGNSLFHNQ
jgi:hypothetical protein